MWWVSSFPRVTKTHKTQKEADMADKKFNEVEGHELLRPLKAVKGSDQMRLLGRLKSLGLMSDDDAKPKRGKAAEPTVELDFEKLADLVDYVSDKFAVNPQKFDEFTSGEDGYNRALELVISYATMLGEGKSSGN